MHIEGRDGATFLADQTVVHIRSVYIPACDRTHRVDPKGISALEGIRNCARARNVVNGKGAILMAHETVADISRIKNPGISPLELIS